MLPLSARLFSHAARKRLMSPQFRLQCAITSPALFGAVYTLFASLAGCSVFAASRCRRQPPPAV